MSLKIEIPAFDTDLHRTTPPPALHEALSSPEKTPEEIHAKCSERDARAQRLHVLHLEAIAARAKRANERANEGVARKLRLEAAKVEKATAALERAQTHVEAKNAERAALREDAKARRQALLDSVRASREARAAETKARQVSLAELESKAHLKRQKAVSARADKGRAAVTHARAVAHAKHEAELAATRQAAERMAERMASAAARRSEALEASVATAAEMGANRLARLAAEKAALEARRLALSRQMAKVESKRQARLKTIQAKAQSANQHAREIASEIKARRASEPAQLRHALAIRMQAADVSRMQSQADKIGKVVAISAGLPLGGAKTSPPPSPKAEPPSPDGSKIRWLGPGGGAGYVPARGPLELIRGIVPPAMAYTMSVAVTKTPVAFEIAAVDAEAGKSPSRSKALLLGRGPPPHLALRLSFAPRMLTATSKARHAAAAGRRATLRALKVARAAYLGTTRVAQVIGRQAGRRELVAALLRAREQRGALNAAAHTHRVAMVGRLASQKVVAAAMRRSAARLELLNKAIAADERRQGAIMRRAKRLLDIRANRYEHAAAVAARARLAHMGATRALKAAAEANRCSEASNRRAAFLDYRVATARACGGAAVLRVTRLLAASKARLATYTAGITLRTKQQLAKAETLIEIQCECFATDIPITDEMLAWTADEARTFFVDGAKPSRPPAAAAAPASVGLQADLPPRPKFAVRFDLSSFDNDGSVNLKIKETSDEGEIGMAELRARIHAQNDASYRIKASAATKGKTAGLEVKSAREMKQQAELDCRIAEQNLAAERTSPPPPPSSMAFAREMKQQYDLDSRIQEQNIAMGLIMASGERKEANERAAAAIRARVQEEDERRRAVEVLVRELMAEAVTKAAKELAPPPPAPRHDHSERAILGCGGGGGAPPAATELRNETPILGFGGGGMPADQADDLDESLEELKALKETVAARLAASMKACRDAKSAATAAAWARLSDAVAAAKAEELKALQAKWSALIASARRQNVKQAAAAKAEAEVASLAKWSVLAAAATRAAAAKAAARRAAAKLASEKAAAARAAAVTAKQGAKIRAAEARAAAAVAEASALVARAEAARAALTTEADEEPALLVTLEDNAPAGATPAPKVTAEADTQTDAEPTLDVSLGDEYDEEELEAAEAAADLVVIGRAIPIPGKENAASAASDLDEWDMVSEELVSDA